DMHIDAIGLVDINEHKLHVMEQVANKIVKQLGKNTVIEASTERRNVLKDAKYVINTIGVGGVELYEQDLQIPEKYGCIQNVGDIIGPGGMFRGLRAFPAILGMCKDMEELCPDAYFFNYTNPMAALCLALSKATKIKVFGFCHNVQSTALQLSAYLGTTMDHVSFWAAGINHMDWFLQYKVDGKDAYPELFEIAKDWKRIEELQKVEPDYCHYDAKVYDFVRFEIMQNFGKYVSESPFHMGEYCPYFRKNEEMIKEYKIEDRWWLRQEQGRDEYFEELEALIRENKEIPISKSFEYAPEIIHANLAGKPFRANLNVPNTGLITNLSNDSVVEVPCYADSEGIHPCYVGEIPTQLAALNTSNIVVHQMMAKAMVEKKYEYIYEGVKLDPMTAANCTLKQITSMVDELIEVNKAYLEGFK
ncbi:MAG: alpha-glucosidase/alpha-galactosidase, partial [Lachnospiraceae bacterium]|nr:alpha-glucosidase/alpha-galactosidase [Lachnospiraceae bacterium]